MEHTHEAAHAEDAPAPAREPAGVAPAAGRMLALQRAAGNQAVLQLLRETDPRLTYTAAAKAEGAGLDAQTLPWNTPGNEAGGWDSEAILSKLTQVDENSATVTDEVRCGANAVLAVAITRGPLATEQFARGIMLAALAQSSDAKLPAERRQSGAGAYSLIWPAIRAVGDGTATYGDLSLIANYGKVVMSEKASAATTGHEVAAMAGLVGGMAESGAPIEDRQQLAMFAKELKRGESYILLVGTNVLAPGVRSRNLDQVNHYVVLGKDAGGKVFLYDPYPRVGTQFLRSGDPNFWTLFETADGRWKASYIFVRPKSF